MLPVATRPSTSNKCPYGALRDHRSSARTLPTTGRPTRVGLTCTTPVTSRAHREGPYSCPSVLCSQQHSRESAGILPHRFVQTVQRCQHRTPHRDHHHAADGRERCSVRRAFFLRAPLSTTAGRHATSFRSGLDISWSSNLLRPCRCEPTPIHRCTGSAA